MKYATIALLAATAVSAFELHPRDITRMLLARETTASGGDAPDGTAQAQQIIDKVGQNCQNQCGPITTLFNDDLAKQCINLTEDALLKNADCNKKYCDALQTVFGCARCQWSVIPHQGATSYDVFDKEQATMQDRFCKNTGVDLTKVQ